MPLPQHIPSLDGAGDGWPRLVLVVDDNLDIRESLKDLLLSEGYQVECAADGKDALQLLQGGLRPQAILLDLMMKGMNGVSFLEAQRADPSLATIPVVVLTANRQAADVVTQCAIATVMKPFRFDQLKGVLDECAARRQIA